MKRAGEPAVSGDPVAPLREADVEGRVAEGRNDIAQ